jgi:hypothetical protein
MEIKGRGVVILFPGWLVALTPALSHGRGGLSSLSLWERVRVRENDYLLSDLYSYS